MKNEDFDPNNVNTWNGLWYCPFCRGPVGSPECSCETSWMLVNDPDIGSSLIVFFKAGTMRSLQALAPGRQPLYAGVVKKIFFVSEEGEILGEAAKRDVFRANSIKKWAEDSFLASNQGGKNN